MRRRNFLAVGSGLTATSNRWIERRLLLGQPAPEILTRDISDPEEEFVDDEHTDLDRSSGTLAINSETGVLRFGSDGNDETVTAIGYLAADALVPGGTWDGTIDTDDNRIGTDVVDNVKALAFTPESFEGIALRATEAIDLYVDGVLVAGDVALVRYATARGVFEVEPVRTAIDDTWPQFQFDTANTGTPQSPEAPPTTNLDEKWHVEFGAIGGSSPAVTDGTVYIGTVDPDGVFALNAETGDVQWDFQTGANVEGAPAVADDTVYVGVWTATSTHWPRIRERNDGASRLPTRCGVHQRWPTIPSTLARTMGSCTH
nr:PQQ-binding-like beta-propeller repeat protein [Natrinema sp. SYSU A 869]